MKKFLIPFCTVGLLLVIESCDRPIGLNENQASSNTRLSTNQISELSDITVKGDYELRDGMLYFKSAKTFFATDSILRKLDRNQRIKFTENLGLSSLLDIKSKIFHELANEDSTDNYSKTILDNKDILKQEGDQLTSVYGMTFEHLVNREGMVSIGGKVHCFGNDRVVIASTVQDARDSYIAGKKLKEDIVYLSKNSTKGAKVSAGPLFVNF